ncbi:MAG: ATP-binding protein [Lachnospiraceae bacterium]|nr:ATP-binding protein [Lachnospiraceae bacterium]
MYKREYWEEACRLFSLTKEQQNLAYKLLKGPLEISAAIGDLKEDIQILPPVFGHTDRDVFLYPAFVSYIKGEVPDSINGGLPEGLILDFPAQEKVYGAGELTEELTCFLGLDQDRKQGKCVVLTGREGSRFLISQVAYRTARPILFWDGMLNMDTELLLTAVLYDAILCLDIRKMTFSDKIADKAADLCKRGLDIAVLAASAKEISRLTDKLSCLVRSIPMTNEADRQAYWNDWKHNNPDKDIIAGLHIFAQKLVKKQVSIAEMKRILSDLELEYTLMSARENHSLTEEMFRRILQRHAKEDADTEGIRRLNANQTLQDLCLPAEHSRRLEQICQMLKKRDTVLCDWGFSEKYAYGNGISILFYGAPGTGKTMAAQVIAAELKLPLYRVDLSSLISKYIGETQKNIAKVFEQTKKLKGILLFDEADALFSRRNEVSDAQDKYANAETAYLLQRIEESDGICILTTNLLQNFDEAFRRRITYMINFPMPDAKLRRQLWEKVFPEKTPLSAELDWELLADNFELSGAAIRNAAMQSAWMAASGSGCVTMQDVLSGIANEYRKVNRALKPDQKALMELYDTMVF